MRPFADWPTVWPADCTERHIDRKLSHGTRSGEGKRFVERALSASVTCRLQGRSLFAYLAALLGAHPRGDPLPTLI